VSNALKLKTDLLIVSELDQEENVSLSKIDIIKSYITKGGKVLLLGSEIVTKLMYPEYITGWIVPTEGDIANLEIPESSIFDGIDELDLRYFNNKREIPTICLASFKVNRNPKLELLASQTKIHRYVEGEMNERSESMKMIKGYPLLRITDNGTIIISTMSVDKATTDPIAGKLLLNTINNVMK
jgi:beta-galactosidase